MSWPFNPFGQNTSRQSAQGTRSHQQSQSHQSYSSHGGFDENYAGHSDFGGYGGGYGGGQMPATTTTTTKRKNKSTTKKKKKKNMNLNDKQQRQMRQAARRQDEYESAKQWKHNNDSWRSQQCQSQAMEKEQQTVEIQTFREQVSDTFNSVLTVAKLSQSDRFNDSMKMEISDAAIMSLNMFAVSCQELHSRSNQAALDLGKKMFHDKYDKLKEQDPALHRLTAKHRQFMEAALDGQKNLRYTEDRVSNGHDATPLFNTDANTINQAFGAVIGSRQKFDKRQDEMLNDKSLNEQLAKQHQSELAEYRTNGKYKESKKTKKAKSSYQRPSQNELYFTESGQKSQFVDKEKEKEEKAMEVDVTGYVADDPYDHLPQNTSNAQLLGVPEIGQVCCQVVPRDQVQREAEEYIVVKLAKPFGQHRRVYVDEMNNLVVDPVRVKKFETQYMRYHKLKSLGYDTLKKLENEIDID